MLWWPPIILLPVHSCNLLLLWIVYNLLIDEPPPIIGSFSSYQGSWPTGLTNKTSNKTDQDRIKIQLDHLGSTQGNKHLETKLRALFHNHLELIWVIYTVKDLLLGGNGKPRRQLLFKLFSVLQRKWLIKGRFFGQIKYFSRYEWMYSIPQSWTWKILERQLCS